jgi:polyhydroxyalkanoate synthesis regulator phasin
MNEATKRAFQTLHRLNRDEAEQTGAFEPRPAYAQDWRGPPEPEPDATAWMTPQEARRFDAWQRKGNTTTMADDKWRRQMQAEIEATFDEVGDDVGLLQSQVATSKRELADLRTQVEVLRDERVAQFPRRAGAA